MKSTVKWSRDLDGAARIEQARETRRDQGPERTLGDHRGRAGRQQPGRVGRPLQQLLVLVVEQIRDGLAVVAQLRGRHRKQESERRQVFDSEQPRELDASRRGFPTRGSRP